MSSPDPPRALALSSPDPPRALALSPVPGLAAGAHGWCLKRRGPFPLLLVRRVPAQEAGWAPPHQEAGWAPPHEAQLQAPLQPYGGIQGARDRLATYIIRFRV